MSFTTDILAFNILLFVIGVAVLVKGSDWFIDGAVAVAHRFKISEAIVGLTLVSLGTSLPELAANVYCSIQVAGGDPSLGDVAMGNIAGSNVANVMLILGLAVTCIGVVPTDKILFYRDTMIMMGISILFAAVCYLFGGNDTAVSWGGRGVARWEGALLLLSAIAYVTYLARTHKKELVDADHEAAENQARSLGSITGLLVIGGIMTVTGSKVMIDNVVWGAEQLKISQAVIASTIVAFGTSVPELAVTLAGIMKKKNDIAIGNVVGSNIFNIALVFSISALIAPVPLGREAGLLVLPVMLASSALLVVFMRTGWSLVRWEGILFLIGYIGFVVGSFFM